MIFRILAATLLLLLAGCHDDGRNAPVPPPQAITESAVAQFCGMNLTEHAGPKGQIFLRGDSKPLWFSSVRDAVAWTMLPEMPKNIAVIYVTDMARTTEWKHPLHGPWVDARKAVFVIGSSRKGGMGANEAVPFSDPAAARNFAKAYGGRIVNFAQIPQSYVLGSAGEQS